jgi:hypothetical protein
VAVKCLSRPVLFTLWLFLTAVLIVGSLQPARPAFVHAVHRGIHWLGFGGSALLLYCLSRTPRQEILGAFATVLLGLSLEFLQHRIGHNSMEWRDVADDALAVLAFFALYRLTGAWKPTPDPHE